MDQERITELEIRQAYQDDLLHALNQVVADQQKQIGKLEETCKLLHERLKSLAQSGRESGNIIDERPPHY